MTVRLPRLFVARPLVSIIALLVAIAIITPMALARLAGNTINPVAVLSPNKRRIEVTGPIICDQTQPVYMRVTVTQRSTGAMAEGVALVIGTVAPQQWRVVVRAIGDTAFTLGPATVVALALSTDSPGHPDDAHQWLVNVTLVEE